MENNIVTLSIYYAREEWNTLIKKCITPLIRSLQMNKEDSDINALLKLYGGNRQDCQLIIYGISQQFEETVAHIEEYIEKFLIQHPSLKSDNYKFKPGKLLWMPPPNNSVNRQISSVEPYFRFPELVFYKQSVTNLLTDWINDNDDIQFDTEDVYTFALFLQLILLKKIIYHNLPFDFIQTFSDLEAKMDISNNMILYDDVIINSSDDYCKNIKQIEEYFNTIDFNNQENYCLYYHYSTIDAILFDNSAISFGADRLLKILMLTSYELLGMTGIKQLYVLNMIKLFCSDYLKINLGESTNQIATL